MGLGVESRSVDLAFSLSGPYYLLVYLYSTLKDALWVCLCYTTCSLVVGVSPVWTVHCVLHGSVLET